MTRIARTMRSMSLSTVATASGVPADPDLETFRAQALALLTDACAQSVPVHVSTASSAWVLCGYLVRTPLRVDGSVDLAKTMDGSHFTPLLSELMLVATIDGRCVSRPVRSGPRCGTRRDAVSASLSGLADLLADPNLSAAERRVLEDLVGQVATLTC